MISTSKASFAKGVNLQLANRPLDFNGRLTNRGLTSLVKRDTLCRQGPVYPTLPIPWKLMARQPRGVRVSAGLLFTMMETFSALLALCAGNSPVTGEVPTLRPVTRSFDVFFDLRLIIRLIKLMGGWWFETPSRSLWRHCNIWLPWRYRSQQQEGRIPCASSIMLRLHAHNDKTTLCWFLSMKIFNKVSDRTDVWLP